VGDLQQESRIFAKKEKDLNSKHRSRLVVTTEIVRRWFGSYSKLSLEQQANIKH